MTEALSNPGSARNPKAVSCGDFGELGYLHINSAAVKGSERQGCDGWELEDSVHDLLVVDAGRCWEVAHGILNVQ